MYFENKSPLVDNIIDKSDFGRYSIVSNIKVIHINYRVVFGIMLLWFTTLMLLPMCTWVMPLEVFTKAIYAKIKSANKDLITRHSCKTLQWFLEAQILKNTDACHTKRWWATGNEALRVLQWEFFWVSDREVWQKQQRPFDRASTEATEKEMRIILWFWNISVHFYYKRYCAWKNSVTFVNYTDRHDHSKRFCPQMASFENPHL